MVSLAAVLFTWQIASSVYPLTWSYYGIAKFGWSNAMIGASLAAVGVVMALSQIFLTGRVVRKMGERKAALLGMAGGGSAFIAYAVITESWMAFAAFAFLALQALVQPSLMAMLSRRGAANTQGEVQGIASMVMGLGSIVAPLLLNPALAFFTSEVAPFRFPGAAFMISALFTLVAMIVLSRTPRAASAMMER